MLSRGIQFALQLLILAAHFLSPVQQLIMIGAKARELSFQVGAVAAISRFETARFFEQGCPIVLGLLELPAECLAFGMHLQQELGHIALRRAETQRFQPRPQRLQPSALLLALQFQLGVFIPSSSASARRRLQPRWIC